MGVHSPIVKMKSVSVKDVDQHKFVRALAAFFKKSGKVKQPEWADLVKTASTRSLLPSMKTGSTFVWLLWSDTSTSDLPSESRPSNASMEDTRTTVLPPPTSAAAPDPSPVKLCRLWKRSNWSRKTPTVDAA